MTAYIVATVRILDPEVFGAYARAIAGVSERYGGTPLVRGVVTEVLEGEGAIGERVVVSSFPDADAARGYVASAEYQAARLLREGAAAVTMRLVA